jgi:ubiquinone/menaquinone biosynthesis C-methylase UbiE
MEHNEQLKELKQVLANQLDSQRQSHFGAVKQSWVEYATEYFWDETQQAFRTNDLTRYGFFPTKAKVLDLAAGCGQFMQYGFNAGYEVWGIEPEKWKLDLIKRKFQLFGLLDQIDRVIEGIGEALPFGDDTFDCVTTYQTLEHVQNPLQVLKEMIRVTKPGGGIYIRCPDYRSTFEAHYQLPWLPLFPRWLAKYYLRLLGRPLAGLDTIQYVTKPNILKMLTALECDGVKLIVFDDSKINIENAFRRRGIPLIPMAFELWTFLDWLRAMFRRELNVNLFVRVVAK